jgi:hypothetical protein
MKKYNYSKKIQNIINILNEDLHKRKNYINDNSNIYSTHKFLKQHHLSDAEGLRRAYTEPNRLYINGDRLYVAGTTWTDGYTNKFSLNDAIDDLKIPFFQTQHIQRYKDAAEALNNNPDINQLVGHSMGSSVILQLNKDNNNKFITRTYSAPVFDLFPHSNDDSNNQRYRTSGDLVSIFDNNANTVYKNSLNPLELHSYNNYGDVGK